MTYQINSVRSKLFNMDAQDVLGIPAHQT